MHRLYSEIIKHIPLQYFYFLRVTLAEDKKYTLFRSTSQAAWIHLSVTI